MHQAKLVSCVTQFDFVNLNKNCEWKKYNTHSSRWLEI